MGVLSVKIRLYFLQHCSRLHLGKHEVGEEQKLICVCIVSQSANYCQIHIRHCTIDDILILCNRSFLSFVFILHNYGMRLFFQHLPVDVAVSDIDNNIPVLSIYSEGTSTTVRHKAIIQI
jgi:hypothetical protein